jgi:predicted nucleotidyltransferase component of viral defense system
MLNFEDILKVYPIRLHAFKENILKEYLQHKILDILFSNNLASKLVFLGGTAIRIIHNSIRFSEDLDFDNLGLSPSDFTKITQQIKYQLELDGYSIEINNVFRSAFRCSIKFPGLLFENQLSGYKEEKILIRLDSEPQQYTYTPDKYLLNKFGIFRYINAVPIDLLLSQKITAIFTRKREMGRDFFDVVYLMSKTDPDYNYLKYKLNIESKAILIKKLKEKSKKLDFKILAQNIEPFLIEPSQKDRVLYFKQWLDTLI